MSKVLILRLYLDLKEDHSASAQNKETNKHLDTQ